MIEQATRLSIDEFLIQAAKTCCLDVRSPSEYCKGRIPGAISLPVFTDAQRAQIGWVYKEKGREAAIRTGLEAIGPHLAGYVRMATHFIGGKDRTVCLYCWRGGMRSDSAAWLLSLSGFRVFVLQGGYKAYRRWAVRIFEKAWPLCVVSGYTGSGKTDVLRGLSEAGEAVLDLEGLAGHRGSAFGALGRAAQPTQEQFENDLAYQLGRLEKKGARWIWVEDESRMIGGVRVPDPLWARMRRAPHYLVRVPKEARIQYLVSGYGIYPVHDLQRSVRKITKRLGGDRTKLTVDLLDQQKWAEAADILLSYYDKTYAFSLQRKGEIPITEKDFDCVDIDAMVQWLRSSRKTSGDVLPEEKAQRFE